LYDLYQGRNGPTVGRDAPEGPADGIIIWWDQYHVPAAEV